MEQLPHHFCHIKKLNQRNNISLYLQILPKLKRKKLYKVFPREWESGSPLLQSAYNSVEGESGVSNCF